MKRPGLVPAALVAAVLVSSCGGGDALGFVGNSTCPTTLPANAPSGSTAPTAYSPSPPDTNGDPVGQVIPEMPHSHVAPPATVKYEHNPPTSGCHYSTAAPDPAPVPAGAYNTAVAPEYWVHNLEHGYVVVLYNCPSGCAADFQSLHDWYKKLGPDPTGQSCATPLTYAKVVIMPLAGMPVKFAAVSWDYYDPMDSLNLSEVQKFYDNHNGHSPEAVCTG